MMNAAAVICFVIARKVWWPGTLAMIIAAIIGGYVGAHLAMRVSSRVMRPVVIAICAGVTLAFFFKS